METFADNIEPSVIDRIFTDQQYEDLYAYINAMPDEFRTSVRDTGYIAFYDPTDDELTQAVVGHAEKILGIKLKKSMFHFARYTNASGTNPRLMPHWDSEIDNATVTISVMLDNTFDWPIYVEAEEYLATKNQGVLFSGTHQIHWRPDVPFKDEDYYDILVCQMIENSNAPVILDGDHTDNMNDRVGNYVKEYLIAWPNGLYSDKDWLEARIEDGWTGRKYCDELGVPIEAVYWWMEHYGLLDAHREAQAGAEPDNND